MSQDQAILLAFKVVEVASVVTITAFVAYYSKVANWWANPIGRTIVIKDVALILVLLPSLLSIFFHFNRLTSYVAAWFDVGSFALVPVIMVWRIIVWHRIHAGSAGKTAQPQATAAERTRAAGQSFLDFILARRRASRESGDR